MSTQAVAKPGITDPQAILIQTLIVERICPDEMLESIQSFQEWMTKDGATALIQAMFELPFRPKAEREGYLAERTAEAPKPKGGYFTIHPLALQVGEYFREHHNGIWVKITEIQDVEGSSTKTVLAVDKNGGTYREIFCSWDTTVQAFLFTREGE